MQLLDMQLLDEDPHT